MDCRGLVKGKTIEIEETLPYSEGQRVLVSVKPWRVSSSCGSPEALLRAIREPPHLDAHDVNELEAAIESAQVPVHPGIILDEGT